MWGAGLKTNEHFVQVSSLTKVYPIKRGFFGETLESVKAVDDVSFTINKGEVVGLVGESGSGKTTVGKMILRLVKPTSGAIFFNGKNIFELNKDDFFGFREKVQIIFQDPYSSLNPRIRVYSILNEVLRVHYSELDSCARDLKIKDMLDKVGISFSSAQKFPHEFSGGQRQRIVIARALAVNPEFIVADEPVSALDVSVQAQILNLLLDLKKEYNLSYLFISHDLSVVRYVSDRVLIMKNGQIVEQGDTEKIYNSCENEYTKKLLSAVYW